MNDRIPRSLLREVEAEASRAIAKHGAQLEVPLGTGPLTTPVAGLSGATESSSRSSAVDVARDATELTDDAFRAGEGTWWHILREEVLEAAAEAPGPELRAELVQAATMALRMICALDAQLGAPPAGDERGFLHAHLRIVYLLAESQGSTHTQLARRWQTKAARPGPIAWPFISDSGLRTRVSELVRWGLVEHSGGWGRTLNNRPSKIWQLVSEPARLALGDHVAPIASVERGSRDVYLALVGEAGTDVILRSCLEVAALAAGIAL
jgi:hypothetical protein